VYFHLVTKPGIQLPNNYRLFYLLQKGYADKSLVEMDTIDLNYSLLEVFRNRYTILHKHRNYPDGNLGILVVKNQNTDNEYFFDVPLQLPNSFPLSNLLPVKSSTGLPVFKSYTTVKDSLELTRKGPDIKNQFYCFRYTLSLNPAIPPMVTTEQPVQEFLKSDSLFQADFGEKFVLKKEGLYLFQTDTSSLEAISIRLEDPFYPKPALVEDLVGPLIYITTRGERENLVSASDTKVALDRFWLNLAKSQEKAKVLIRDYFQQVRMANFYFTGFKEGWKTDRGMIYILFGSPDEVYRDGEQEVWIYNRTEENKKVSFNFIKIKNFFDPGYYSLIRNSDYDKIWFRMVDRWRKGMQDI
jgi:GWxTD domain-containing protein